MKIYVATSFSNLEEARTHMAALKARGHTITHDWTQDSDAGLHGKERTDYLIGCAFKDSKAVEACDLFWLINDDRARGAFTELGIAYAKGKRIVVVPSTHAPAALNVFALLAEHTFSSLSDALAHAHLWDQPW